MNRKISSARLSVLLFLGVFTLGSACIVGSKPDAPVQIDEKDPLVLCGGNTEVLADHTIRSAEDVQAMAGCETLIGTLVIERSDLETLDGLETLREIDGYLYVHFWATRPSKTSVA